MEGQPVELDEDLLLVIADVVDTGSGRELQPTSRKAVRTSDVADEPHL